MDSPKIVQGISIRFNLIYMKMVFFKVHRCPVLKPYFILSPILVSALGFLVYKQNLISVVLVPNLVLQRITHKLKPIPFPDTTPSLSS